MSNLNQKIEVETTTTNLISKVYQKLQNNIIKYRKVINRPLTISEKILIGHFDKSSDFGSTYIDDNSTLSPAKDYVLLNPDRVALQDVTGQMTILQFIQAGLKRTAVPTTVHCDHLIQARVGSESDTKLALYENNEVYKFLESASRKFGIGFWKPGSGIIHQVILENYAFPGGLMIGTDSHTPNAGGLGMIAIGVGGLDAAEVMAGMSWELLFPKRIGVFFTGKLNGWTSPKDIILYVASKLTVYGGTNAIIEYFGPGSGTISCTGKATITNMGAEIGATCSIFSYDEKMETYLRATKREGIADLANKYRNLFTLDNEIEEEIKKEREKAHLYFDQLIEIDLSSLEPYIVGPHTPDLARPISKLASEIKKNSFLDTISVALIGSCTNSSYEDMSRASDIAEQAKSKGVKVKIPLQVTPGSEMIRGTIVTSYNRNFPGRNDGRMETMNFIGSPELVIALALGGRLSFNPLTDELIAIDGSKFKLNPPKVAPEIPSNGFAFNQDVYLAPTNEYQNLEVTIDPNSSRLQKLKPFAKWDGNDFEKVPILVKVKGKCTTDHISPAGPWLMYRGHLDKISDNLLLGAVNAFHEDQVGKGKNIFNHEMQLLAHIAREYKSRKIKWIIIGNGNYGEGSSREHAAMTPRYLGCCAVIARSFARIHETNLKKQGILALTFVNPKDYDKIMEDDRLSILAIKNLQEGKYLKCIIHHSNTSEDDILLRHSYNPSQIDWFKAGSALNLIRS